MKEDNKGNGRRHLKKRDKVKKSKKEVKKVKGKVKGKRVSV